MPPLYLRVFERLLIEANHTDTVVPYRDRATGKTVQKTVKRGERITSIRQICRWVAWYERGILKEPNPRTIVKILDYLEQNIMLTIYRDGGNRSETHYKVCNYEAYQADETCESNGKVTPGKQSVHTNKNDRECINSTSQQPDGNCDKQKKFPRESEPYRAAVYLDKQVCSRLTKKIPADERGLQNWAIHFDRLHRIDKQSWEDIAEVLQFSQQDSFWQSNILSANSFRDKYWKLVAKMKSEVMQ